MTRLLQVQFIASSIVLSVLLGAELSSWLLELHPSSPLLWHLNLVVFRPVQQVMYLNSPMHLLLGPATGPTLLGLIGLGAALVRYRRPLAVALLSHACLIAALALGRSWSAFQVRPETASLAPYSGFSLPALTQADGVVVVIMAASILATVAGHLSFLLDFWKRRLLSAGHET